MVELVLAWKELSCCSASWTTSAKPLCCHVTPSGSHHETLKGSPNTVNIVCLLMCNLMINDKLHSRIIDLLNTALVSQAHSILGSRGTCENTKSMYATAHFVERIENLIGRITDRIATPGSSSGLYSYMTWRKSCRLDGCWTSISATIPCRIDVYISSIAINRATSPLLC